MSISKIRRWILDKNLAEKKVVASDKLKLDLFKIGLVAQVQNSTDIDQIEQFLKKKEQEGKRVSYLLFSSNKQLINDHLLEKKDIKWTGEPKGEKVAEFLSKEYDILYCPTKQMEFPLEYMVKKVMATIKVGVHSTESLPYLDISADTGREEISIILKEIDIILKNLLKNG
jgi:hypothetical protein